MRRCDNDDSGAGDEVLVTINCGIEAYGEDKDEPAERGVKGGTARGGWTGYW